MKQENDILRWFNRDVSPEELEQLRQGNGYEAFKKIAHYSSYLEPPTVDPKKALEELKKKEGFKKQIKVRTLKFKTFYRAAAVIILFLASAYFLFFNNLKSYDTSAGQTLALTLPDNSTVVLNAHSELSYNKKTWNSERTLELDGEAFFKVSKGETFSVRTPTGTVKVLGTQFNVKERRDYFEVKCYEGLVRVTSDEKTVELSKGEIFRILDGKIETFEYMLSLQPSWIEKESSFSKVPLKQVIAELERQYDLKISVEGVDQNQLFTGSFTHKDLTIALQSITIPLKISYKIEGNNVLFFEYEGQ